MIRYRPDIDGLRAVAILLVIFFHADLPLFHGGYVGVDVFFVISGYLITSIILRHLKQGDFSLINFYERRIRRIFPALTAVLAFSLACATLLMMPQELSQYGKNLAATAVFASNIMFWREAGYFDLGSAFKPLLHTWSIAVEEQFYIFFPLYMILVFRWFRNHYVLITIAVLISSFCLAVWTLSLGKAAVTFYFLPTRAWELLIGAVLAFGVIPNVNNAAVCNLLSATGLGLIIAAATLFSPATTFPGPHALLPTTGAALLIHAAIQETPRWPLVNQALAHRSLVFLGKISYSLYLWHWPIFIFTSYYLIRKLTPVESLLCIALCFLIAGLSWKYIEQPFRRKGNSYTRPFIFRTALLITVFFFGAGLALDKGDGFPGRLPPAIQKLAIADKGTRGPSARVPGFPGINRILGDPDAGSPTFLAWGDSHANALSPALDKVAREDGKSGILVKLPGCPPLLDVSKGDLNAGCRKFNNAVKALLQSPKGKIIHTVFLIAQWSSYPRNLAHTSAPEGTSASTARFEALLSETIGFLQALGKKVYIVDEVPPVTGHPVPSILGRSNYYNKPMDIRPRVQNFLDHQAYIHEILERLARNTRAGIIFPYKLLCEDGICNITHDGKSLYYDDNHLSTYGAREISAIFSPAFR